MPIYEYQCPTHGLFELNQRISDPPAHTCPRCGQPVVRQISRSSFVLKGSGWYASDYGSGSSGKGSS